MTLAGRDTSVANRLHWASASSNVQPQIKHRVSSVLFNGRVLVLCVRPLSASQRYVVSGASTANPTSTAPRLHREVRHARNALPWHPAGRQNASRLAPVTTQTRYPSSPPWYMRDWAAEAVKEPEVMETQRSRRKEQPHTKEVVRSTESAFHL